MIDWVIPLLLLAMAAGGGCRRQDADVEAAEKLRAAIAAETGDTNIQFRVENGSIQIRSEGGSLTIDQTETRTRPAELPADILLPADARYDLWTEGPQGSTLSLLTDLSPEQLKDFLRQQWTAQAWQEASAVQADTVWRLAFAKEDRQVAITIEPDPEQAPATRALLFIEPHPKEQRP